MWVITIYKRLTKTDKEYLKNLSMKLWGRIESNKLTRFSTVSISIDCEPVLDKQDQLCLSISLLPTFALNIVFYWDSERLDNDNFKFLTIAEQIMINRLIYNKRGYQHDNAWVVYNRELHEISERLTYLSSYNWREKLLICTNNKSAL